jgi:acetyl-CoA carboxylase biotin carboxyl carrier protein
MSKKETKPKSSLKVVAAAPARKGSGTSGGIDFESVRELARIAAEFDLAEVEADGSGHVRVRRGGGVAIETVPAMSGPRSIALTPAAPAAAPEAAGTFISSPFVGTFYRAPSPEAPAFVDAGQAVRKGQVVCIVEAMKLMNEIEAEAEGKIEEILVQNGEHVEYGQHLFRLSK